MCLPCIPSPLFCRGVAEKESLVFKSNTSNKLPKSVGNENSVSNENKRFASVSISLISDLILFKKLLDAEFNLGAIVSAKLLCNLLFKFEKNSLPRMAGIYSKVNCLTQYSVFDLEVKSVPSIFFYSICEWIFTAFAPSFFPYNKLIV